MWFKNLLIYRFTRPFEMTPEQIQEKLVAREFAPCGSQELFSLGWVRPLGQQGSELVHVTNGCVMVCAQRQEKVLPAAVVKEALEEKVQMLREDEDRNPGRKERLEMKEELVFEMLPKAFAKSRKQYAYIDPTNGWLIVDSATHKRAEELMVLLRECLGSLPVIPVVAKNTVHHSMTDWLKTHAPEGFSLGGECELIDAADESAVIRCKNQNLASPEILSHVEGGMFVSKLAMQWGERLEFVLDDQLTIKRLRFGDLIMEKADDIHTDSAAEQFDVDFSIMSAEFAQFIPAILGALGGEDLSDVDG
ncbi:recombination-associated protein RdgC [Spongiibacter taiwanensis]|uniref:recombination-associated protein RdgC n=1 Tax=Spongiibacter taiwanensis TaxID=1748242 RepID=UPI002035FDDA|nr:recombination-associated protein RdgC [Spongiibacter taiwanensis]USA43492.1 recombination-associated protein RdgC [Spongiibacter taiwanensis]